MIVNNTSGILINKLQNDEFYMLLDSIVLCRAYCVSYDGLSLPDRLAVAYICIFWTSFTGVLLTWTVKTTRAAIAIDENSHNCPVEK